MLEFILFTICVACIFGYIEKDSWRHLLMFRIPATIIISYVIVTVIFGVTL